MKSYSWKLSSLDYAHSVYSTSFQESISNRSEALNMIDVCFVALTSMEKCKGNWRHSQERL